MLKNSINYNFGADIRGSHVSYVCYLLVRTSQYCLGTNSFMLLLSLRILHTDLNNYIIWLIC